MNNPIIVHRGDLIAVDLDGVGAQLMQRILETWKREFPHIPSPKYEEHHSYEVGFGLPEKDKQTIRAIWQRPGFYLNLDPEPGFVEAVEEMRADGLDVIFCSIPTIPVKDHLDLTDATSHSDKVRWLSCLFGRWAAINCHLTHDKTLIRADVLIDDKPTIDGRCRPFWQHIYYDQPWNREAHMDRYGVPKDRRGVARLHRWSDWRTLIQISSR